MKNTNFKRVAGSGVAVALGVMFLASGALQNGQAYAIENREVIDVEALAQVLKDEADGETPAPKLSAEEARSAADELVTTIRRLEATPDYQKTYRLEQAMNCVNYDGTSAENYYNCAHETTTDEIRSALLEAVPNDQKAAAEQLFDDSLKKDTDNVSVVAWNVAKAYVPWHIMRERLNRDVIDIHSSLKSWTISGQIPGMTPDLTVDNLARIFERTGNIYSLSGHYPILEGFWEDLAILQADTYDAKIARLRNELSSSSLSARWLNLISSVYRAEAAIGTSDERWTSNALSSDLIYFVGDTSNLTVTTKIAMAKNLSDYGQVKTLYDVLWSVCNADDDKSYIGSTCITELRKKGYSESELYSKYEQIARLTKLMFPEIMDGLYDYQLALASLPGDSGNTSPNVPKAPNAGSEGSELAGTIAKVAVAGMASITTIAGIIITVKRYAFSPLKRKK